MHKVDFFQESFLKKIYPERKFRIDVARKFAFGWSEPFEMVDVEFNSTKEFQNFLEAQLPLHVHFSLAHDDKVDFCIFVENYSEVFTEKDFMELKMRALELAEFLAKLYPIEIYYSGYSKFYIFVKKDEFTTIDSEARRALADVLCDKGFVTNRGQLFNNKLYVRLPYTVNGFTGFYVWRFKTIEDFRKFNPFRFRLKEEKVKVTIIRDFSGTNFYTEFFGPYKVGDVVEVPLNVALFLVGQNFAVIS